MFLTREEHTEIIIVSTAQTSFKGTRSSAITCITPAVLTRVHHECERRLHGCLQRNSNHGKDVLLLRKKVVISSMDGDFDDTVYYKAFMEGVAGVSSW